MIQIGSSNGVARLISLLQGNIQRIGRTLDNLAIVIVSAKGRWRINRANWCAW